MGEITLNQIQQNASSISTHFKFAAEILPKSFSLHFTLFKLINDSDISGLNTVFHEPYIRHCFYLAEKGQGWVSPNPMVGAVLVHDGEVIGEGFHRVFGGPHAEVMAIHSVIEQNKARIPLSCLYVSLEPCNHHGKTPPCTQLIVASGIKNLIYSCMDPNPQMSGKSLQWLKNQGIKVCGPVLEQEGRFLIRAFSTNVMEKRPYIILKFAQSADGFMGKEGQSIRISNEVSNLLVHKWRSHCDGIAIGFRTLQTDRPQLTTRHWPGKSPKRVLLSNKSEIPQEYRNHFDDSSEIITLKPGTSGNWMGDLANQMQQLYQKGIGQLMVEGGPKTLQKFIDSGLWDEARVITNTQLQIKQGLKAPTLMGRLVQSFTLNKDHICIFLKSNSLS